MPYEPLGNDDAVKKTKIPPTFSVHRYASAIGNPIGGMNDFGPIPDTSEHKRTQKVVRMGRSFSVRMSSQGELFSLVSRVSLSVLSISSVHLCAVCLPPLYLEVMWLSACWLFLPQFRLPFSLWRQ